MNKDVLYTINEIVHRDLIKQLNAEYLRRLKVCNKIDRCDNVCKCYITIKYNTPGSYPKSYNFRTYFRLDIYTKYGKRRCCISKKY